MTTGSIKFYNDEKGFGFIIPMEWGGEDLFFHITQCEEGYDPAEGDEVTFEIGQGRDGRSAAQEVRPTGNTTSTGDDDHGDDDQEEQQEEEGQEEA